MEYYVVKHTKGLRRIEGIVLEVDSVTEGTLINTKDFLKEALGTNCERAPSGIYDKKIKVVLGQDQFALEKPNGSVLVGTRRGKKNRDIVFLFLTTP